MDKLTLAGILIALSAIIGGNILEGGYTHSLVQLTAFVIVMGGTLGAIMVQTRMGTFMRAIRMIPWIFKPPVVDIDVCIQKIVKWSHTARKEGLLGLESIAESEPDEFARIFMMLHQKDIAEGIFLSSGVVNGGINTEEQLIDTAAHKLGMDPLDLRLKNIKRASRNSSLCWPRRA